MNRASENCILFFIKHPAAGTAKTRLVSQLGPDVVSDLYKNFVIDILDTLNKLKADLKIFFDPPDAGKQIRLWLGEEYCYAPQLGRDLGERMKNAFLQTFSEGFNNVIIIGSDSPDLPAEYLDLAFTALDTNDVVIGPSSDGGYYLLGFLKEAFLAEVFDQISWSSDRVCEQTINILKQHKRKLYLLPQWYDVDTPADLNGFVERNINTAFSRSNSIAMVRKIKKQIIC